MSIIETYYKDVQYLFEYDDIQNLLKKTIDLTLDTEDILFYKKTISLLNSLDNTSKKDTNTIKDEIKTLLTEIFNFLSTKQVKQKSLLLEVKDLEKRYDHSAFAMGPINFSISEGEIVGLVGENGNGKTTLLRSLCGELKPNNGSINYNFDSENDYDLRTKLIYIPQRTKDWHGSMIDNLKFTAASYDIKGEENELLTSLIIARMGLWTYRHHNWKSLSSGYKMRFELARMLLRKPKLLLIDEPLANLDIVAQQVVLDDFKNIAKSPFRPLGIVLSSQQLYEVEKTSDHVIFLKNGKQITSNAATPQATEFENEEKLIIEFESNWQQEDLLAELNLLNIEKLQIKGGTYIATFRGSTNQSMFLQTIVDKNIDINYFRNISNSTRRFFL